MTLPVLVVGAGGHAKVLVDALLASSVKIVGLVDSDPAKKGLGILEVEVLGGDDCIARFPPAEIALVNGVGTTGSTAIRRSLFEKFRGMGYRFATVLHPSAIIAASARLGEGVQCLAGSVVQPDCTIGANTIVNTNASVDHDCVIGSHVHVAPGVTLSGGVRVGDNAHIGAGSTVLQGVEIGPDCVVGAGSVVLTSVPPGHKVAGVPAGRLKP